MGANNVYSNPFKTSKIVHSWYFNVYDQVTPILYNYTVGRNSFERVFVRYLESALPYKFGEMFSTRSSNCWEILNIRSIFVFYTPYLLWNFTSLNCKTNLPISLTNDFSN